MRIIVAALAFLISWQASAAVPPYWDHVNRIKAVLAGIYLSEQLHDEPITLLQELSNLRYKVATKHCTTVVTLEKLPGRVDAAGRVSVGAVEYGVESIAQAACVQ